jgi:hypothetical protein
MLRTIDNGVAAGGGVLTERDIHSGRGIMRLLQGGKLAKRIEILNDPALNVDCPVCEAALGVRCHVQPGVVRFDSHFERKELAEARRLERIAESEAMTAMVARGRGREWSDS